jgi:hypothetical protein
MRPTGILICVPAMGQQMCAATALSLFTTAQFLAAKNINCRMTWYAAADIEDIRNLFVTAWYDGHPEFSHMLFVDADMGFEPELIRDFIRFDKPLVGALYAKRKMPASIVGTVPEGHSHKDVVHGFIPATGLGCGVMMIARDVITTMLHRMPHLSDSIPSSLAEATPDLKLTRIIRAFDKMRDGDKRLSEDMAFCYRWQQCGGEVWANVNHKISHIGPFDFHMRYGGVLEAKAREQAEQLQGEAA